jgi:hypothetical protein
MSEEKTIKTSGNSFSDVQGKPKHLRKKNGKMVHTGNENYIKTSEGIVYHQTSKIYKKFSHICGNNKHL